MLEIDATLRRTFASAGYRSLDAGLCPYLGSETFLSQPDTKSPDSITREMLHFSLILLLVALSLGVPRRAWADTKSCAVAHASGQREVRAGRLRLASELFTTCGSDESCPDEIRAECTEFLESVRRTVPSVILSVVDGSGSDVSNVRVTSGDELLSEELDGRALELDPGKHRLRFVLPDGEVIVSEVVIREGEKNRLVEVRLGKGEDAAQAAPSPREPARTEPSPPAESEGPPAGAYVASGVAIAGLGTFAGFAIAGNAEKNALEGCAPSCGASERDRYDAMKRSFLIADVGLGVSAVSAVVAAILFVSGGSTEHPRRDGQARTRVGLRTGGRDASLVLSGGF